MKATVEKPPVETAILCPGSYAGFPGKLMRIRGQFLSSMTVIVLQAVLLNACTSAAKKTVAETPAETTSQSQTLSTKDQTEVLNKFATSPPTLSKDEVLAKYLRQQVGRRLLPSDYLLAADHAYEQYDYDGSVILCDDAIALAPNEPQAYFFRGRARLNSTKAEDQMALADLQKSVDLHYQGSGAYEFMARIYDAHGNTDKAIWCMGKAIEADPNDRNFYKARAALYAAQGKNELAKKDYDTLVKMDPKGSFPYLLRGQLLEKMGNYEPALADFKMAATVPKDVERGSISKRDLAFKLRAALLSRLNRHEEALATLTQALGEDTHDDELLKLRGDEQMALKKYDAAIADYTDAIDSAPDFSRAALEGRGKAYEIVGKKDLAEKDLSEAKKLQDRPAEKVLN